MQSLPQDLASCSQSANAALEELTASQNDVATVAEHCKNAFQSSSGDDQTFKSTTEYVTNVLQQVVYHVYNVSLQVSNYMDVQLKEIEKLDLQVRTLSDRMKASHDATGAPEKQSLELPKNYTKSDKIRKLEGADLPESAQPLEPYTREPIDITALDNVGSSGSTTHTSSEKTERD